MKLKLICLDLHGVLVDACKGFADKLNNGDCIYNQPENLGDYGAVKQYPGFLKFLSQDSTAHFWENLDFYNHVPQLVSKCRDLADEVVIVSHSTSGNCYAGSKVIAKYLGLDFISTEHKHHLAGEDVLLIDDCDANVTKFMQSGGLAITFPQKWNQFHLHSRDPYNHVAMVLDTMYQGVTIETLNTRQA